MQPAPAHSPKLHSVQLWIVTSPLLSVPRVSPWLSNEGPFCHTGWHFRCLRVCLWLQDCTRLHRVSVVTHAGSRASTHAHTHTHWFRSLSDHWPRREEQKRVDTEWLWWLGVIALDAGLSPRGLFIGRGGKWSDSLPEVTGHVASQLFFFFSHAEITPMVSLAPGDCEVSWSS